MAIDLGLIEQRAKRLAEAARLTSPPPIRIVIKPDEVPAPMKTIPDLLNLTPRQVWELAYKTGYEAGYSEGEDAGYDEALDEVEEPPVPSFTSAKDIPR